MEEFEKRIPYRSLTFAAVHEIVTEFLRLTDQTLKTPIQTYRLSDENSSVTYNSLSDLSATFDRYANQYINITGADDSTLQLARIATSFTYKVAGTPQVISRVVAKLDAALNSPQSFAANPVIFIGHGRKEDWKLLRDHLKFEQKFQVEFFESGIRAGKSIRTILDAMKAKSGCAILVYTGEDRLENGELRPRLNVVYECGFFSAALGEGKTFVLLEEGVNVPTNQAGEQYIEYPVGAIQTVFGRVVAAVRQVM